MNFEHLRKLCNLDDLPLLKKHWPSLVSALLGSMITLALSMTFSKSKSPTQPGAARLPAEAKRIITLSPEILKSYPISFEKLKEQNQNTELVLSGKVQHDPYRVAFVSARTQGRVVKVLVSESDGVKKGQALALLQSAELAQAETDHLKAIARFQLMSEQENRYRELFEHQIVSAKEYGANRLELENSKAELNMSRVHLKALGWSETEISRLEREHNHSGELTVRSPLKGAVLEKKIKIGELVKADDLIFTIGDLETVRIELDAYESDIPFIRDGMLVDINPGVSEKNGWHFQAKVSRISYSIEASTRSARIWLDVPNPERKLKFGQAVTGRVYGAKANEASKQIKVAPVEAIHKIEGKTIVFIKSSENTFESREVKTGLSSDQWIEILSGVHENEWIAGAGSFAIKSEYLKQ